ncbi:putative 3-beta-hydroxysteroid-4-alpha-carboxylate 3-dehydrogenase (decarboxylating) [Helianthus annuus]|uniref:Reticulon-like protein n=1 Tax=Helianthus annuus TaxID=4232 RepID=A0A251SZN9_HELAN|nr:3beta-hydroxysteroid-dehydrogenase/decarboxylase [Helianthus annuus]KAF5775091.1 putative 3-beta-hydroxysteroid-4-alpha-carboxylate 3-dehydrogenase (decarboxylating) [Helianthus annuus]KAJ0478297.1 putative 3-beta-hydroxysteroid-4-alpha-carboxylate 3-dehydrogenase (decarboxylating) [Helianthus annuus]KAJ0483005.1 putative 3-beta-hydroxysteroid-4-alpha-carboxylate 3-dehydrogenase (decarboxylating) [Helianthus annuus]KAJ0499180.1 putative 3-beta-hydroxysteroid-4-alpha-carboxylate 3-dehydrogena
MAMVDDQSKTCTVLGGRSFVGRSLVARLLKLGFWIVRVADSTQSLQLDPDDHDYDVPLDRALSTGRAFYFHVDVRNKKSVINAIEGSSVVFYVNDDSSCNHDFFSGYTIIVQGVKNVISACQECKVKRLIYNSTADVVLDNSHDIHNGNEMLLYATKFKNVYSELKAQAEATVLLANDMDGLLTCALRPSNVFGPRDEQLLPSLVDVAKSSWAKFIIGSDVNMCDYTYMENVAHALICAEAALVSRMVTVSGKAFFVTNLEPMSSWEFSLRMLEGLGYYRPMVKIPDVVVRLMVYLIKVMHLKTNSRHNSNSSVHNIVRLMSHTTTYDCSAAQHHLEYSPVVSLDEGITSTIESFSHLAKDSSVILDEFYEQSKIAQLLGGGDVAEILLWRDERKSFFCFCGVVSLFYWFFLCERTAVSSAAQLLLLVTVFLYGYSLMSTEMSSYSRFEVSEKGMRNFVTNIVSIWNGVSHVIKSLAQGRSWSFFLKVAVPLYFFKLFLVNYFPISLGLALAFSFILLFIYEQYEEEINGLIGILNELTRQYVVSEISLLLMNTSTRPSMSKDVR